jgi:hypothetical protein
MFGTDMGDRLDHCGFSFRPTRAKGFLSLSGLS